MKITFPSPDLFTFKPCEIAGVRCVLITPPHLGMPWTKQTMIFRSSLWTVDGEPVSLGFKKFFNWGEKPELVSLPTSLKSCDLIEKIDGSCLVVSFFRGQVIVRTRGTVDATTLKNGHEIAVLKERYPKVFEPRDTAPYSFIFEWTSPTNKIVLNYGDEPDMLMTGLVSHEDYSLMGQADLDKMAEELGVRRPRRYNYANIPEMLSAVEALQGQEGLCVYCNKGQQIIKVKSASYLALHALKSSLTTDKLAEMWFLWEQPDYQTFCDKFQQTFDYECFVFAQRAIAALFDGIREYKKIVAHLQGVYEAHKDKSRKDFAAMAQAAYGDTKKFGMLMNLYSGKQPRRETVKHILLQNTKQFELGMFGKEVINEGDL